MQIRASRFAAPSSTMSKSPRPWPREEHSTNGAEIRSVSGRGETAQRDAPKVSAALLIVIICMRAVLLFGRAEVEPVLIHRRCHYLKGLFLIRKIYPDLNALKLRVKPKVLKLIDREPKNIGPNILAALSTIHECAS
jgi:hypothetical protein